MKDEDKTKEQLIAELWHKNMELELARKGEEYSSTASEMSSPSRRFFTDRLDSLVSFSNGGQQPIDNSNKYHISDLINIPLLEQLLNSYYVSSGISHSLLDTDNNVLIRTGWQDICGLFHCACPQTQYRCTQSYSHIANHVHDGPYFGDECLNGLMHYAVPIIIEGEHLATLHKGQFLFKSPDEDFFRRQAQEYGFNEEAYIEALRRVPIIPEDQVASIMEFFSQLGQFLSTIGLERKRQLESTDKALKEREERLRLVLEASTEGFWDWNIETGEIYRSGRWLDILGYSVNEPDMQYWTKLVHPDDIDAAMKVLNDYLEGRIPKYEAEYRLLTKSGEIKWILERGSVIKRNKNGEPLRLAGTCTDISDRKKSEALLRLSEDKFSKAFRCNPDPITITTLQEGFYVEMNDAWIKTTGYERHEVIGHTAQEMSIWTVMEERDQMLQYIQETGCVHNYEAKYRMKSGEIRNFLVSAEIIDMDNTTHLLCVHKDITERNKMEVEMTRLDRLNLVGEMAASIGHEIRNPMTTVRGYLQLLQENNDYHQEIEYFDLMIEELDRANAIITEFLSLAKNKMVEFKITSLNIIISKLLPLIQAKAMSRDQHINVELNDLPDILLDNKEIRQLILNLVNNGMESMSSAGGVTIRTFVGNGKVVLAIQDQGHGIDRGLLNNLGTPFFTTKEQGTGLGLAICYRIAARHNAQIDIDTSSTGTSFYVRFPIQ